MRISWGLAVGLLVFSAIIFPPYSHASDFPPKVVWVLEQSKDGETKTSLSPAGIKEHLQLDTLHWVAPKDEYISCVDGRNEEECYGTVGGDFGEWLLGLDYYNEAAGSLTQAESDRLLIDFINTLKRPLFWHTDHHALEYIGHHFGVHELEVDDLLIPDLAKLNTTQGILESVLSTHPQAIGCGHVRLALQRPDEYLMNGTAGIVSMGIRSFYHVAWASNSLEEARKQIHFPVLTGDHLEQALITVIVRPNPYDDIPLNVTAQPKLVPRRNEAGERPMHSTFVYHPDVIGPFRESIADFLFSRLSVHSPELTASVFLDEMTLKGSVQLSETVYHLASKVPWYSLTAYISRIPETQIPLWMYIGIVALAVVGVLLVMAIILCVRIKNLRKTAGYAPIPSDAAPINDS